MATPAFEDSGASNPLFVELHRPLGARPQIVALDDGSVREPLRDGALSSAGLQGCSIRLTRGVRHPRVIALGAGHMVGPILR